MKVSRLDHLVLTVADLEATLEFYCRHLGLREVTFGEGRKALALGDQKINLHVRGREIAPHAKAPTPGSADLCLLAQGSPQQWKEQLEADGVPVEFGPVRRTGALGPIESIYLRDPDGNLIELCVYLEETPP